MIYNINDLKQAYEAGEPMKFFLGGIRRQRTEPLPKPA